jgi:membrane-associated phospholipid phosphatase
MRMHGSQLILILVLLLLGSGVFGGIADSVVQNGAIVQVDLAVRKLLPVQEIRPPLKTILRLISLAGSEFIFVASVPLATYLLWQRCRSQCALLLLAVGGGEAVNLLLKMSFARQKIGSAKPPRSLSDYTFPSGHAMVAFIFYCLMLYLIAHKITSSTQRVLLSATTTAIVLLIGFSQLLVGGHYVSDVLAGYAAGLVWLVLTILSVEAVRDSQSYAVK